MENIKKAIEYLREDAHSRLGIPLMVIGWLTVAGVVVMIGNFDPHYWHSGLTEIKRNFINSYTLDRSQ